MRRLHRLSVVFSEEREKRKGEFEKEIQMIIKSQEEKAVEMARRMKTKATKQGLVDNDANYSLSVENSVSSNDCSILFFYAIF